MTSFFACLFSFFLVIVLIAVIRFSLKTAKGWPTMICFYCLCMLFFIAFPLLFDSLFSLFFSHDELCMLLVSHNLSELARYEQLSQQVIFPACLYSLVFNLLLILTYLICRKKNAPAAPATPAAPTASAEDLNTDDNIYFRPIVYWACAWAGLFFWGLKYGINFSQAGFGYRSLASSSNSGSGSFFLVASAMLFSASLPGLNLKSSMKYLNYIMIGIPFAVLCYLTESRALFISFFCILFYFIQKRYYGHLLKSAIFLIVIFFAVLTLCLSIRSKELTLCIYPVWRDFSVFDMYYCFDFGDAFFPDNMGFKTLVTTGIPFIPRTEDFVDIPANLAGIRFFEGWGTLHPTLMGWCFFDFGWNSLLYALYFGFLIAISERIQMWMKKPLNMMYLGTQFIFVCILVRGSCQVAYAEFIYPTFGFVILNLLLQKVNFDFLIAGKSSG